MVEETMPHKLNLEDRKKLSMTGVTEVISFDDTSVILRTVLGILVVQGSELQLKNLTLEGGNVAVEGQITSLAYEQVPARGGLFRRFFG